MRPASDVIICGLSVPPEMPAMSIDGVEIRWTGEALRSLEALRSIGEKIGKADLPYRSLSWLAEMACPGTMLADASVGLGRRRLSASMQRALRREAVDP